MVPVDYRWHYQLVKIFDCVSQRLANRRRAAGKTVDQITWTHIRCDRESAWIGEIIGHPLQCFVANLSEFLSVVFHPSFIVVGSIYYVL